jgi:hypothetical protein
MSDRDSTPIDGTRPNTSGHGVVTDHYPDKSVNDMKQMIADNKKAMDASGDDEIVMQQAAFKAGRGPKPTMSAIDWWQLRYNNSSYHVSLHLKQDKLHEAHTN